MRETERPGRGIKREGDACRGRQSGIEAGEGDGAGRRREGEREGGPGQWERKGEVRWS